MKSHQKILFLQRKDAEKNPGGDVLQLQQSAEALRKMGIEVDILHHSQVKNWHTYDAIQAFNIGRPADILPVLKKSRAPLFLYSIWVDFYDFDKKNRGFLFRLSAQILGRFRMEYLKVIARWLKGSIPTPPLYFLLFGQKKSMQKILNHSRVLMSSTEHEQKRLTRFFKLPNEKVVIPLGVHDLFHKLGSTDTPPPAKNSLFFAGYLEGRKNLLPLIRICNKRNWELHVVGQASEQNSTYAAICKKTAGSTIHFHGYLAQKDYLHILSACRVVVQPSWFETTGLTALEGAVAGKNIVVGKTGDTPDVFQKYAFYCDPSSEKSIEEAIENALKSEVKIEQEQYYAQFSWEKHAESLLQEYKKHPYKKRIGIFGTRGIPNQYGGFEELAEHLGVYLTQKEHAVFVYQTHNHSYQKQVYKGINLIRKHNPETYLGTFGQFFYDLFCLLDARKRKFDVLLQLGYTSSAVWFPLWPSNTLNIVNMDGWEWKRSKYNRPVRRFLKWSEKMAYLKSDIQIADHPEIARGLQERYGKEPKIIAYGAHIRQLPQAEEITLPAPLKWGEYDLLIARMEPENNIETILKAYFETADSRPLVLLGNFQNAYGKRLYQKYPPSEKIIWMGAIYEKGKVDQLRFACHSYLHGHSVGGTNPSLIEAMACHCRIIAHDNPFNRGILGKNAVGYFTDSDSLKAIILEEHSNAIRPDFSGEIAEKYSWEKICKNYEEVFFTAKTPKFYR